MTDTEISEAPAQESGAENMNANLSLEDLASSFVEKVEAENEESTTEATEEHTESKVVVAEADEDSEDVLLKSSTEEEDSEDVEEETEEEIESKPKGLNKALKQIGRLTARAKGAEEQVQELKAEIDNLKSQKTESSDTAENPTLEKVQTFQELETLRKEAMEAKKWAIKNLNQEYVEVNGKEYDGESIRNILAEAEEHLSEKIPQRANFLQQRQNWKQDTVNTFPWVQKGEGAEYELYLQVRQGDQYKPLLDSLPNGDFVAATLVEGINSIKARQKSKTAKKVQTPPATEMSDTVAPPVGNKKARLEKKRKAILGKGNVSVNQFAQYLNT